MRIRSDPKPFKLDWVSTGLTLFLLACAASLTIWSADPFLTWGYEVAIFLVGITVFLQAPLRFPATWFVLPAISLWGFAQLAVGATVYRWATLNAALQVTALAVTAVSASVAFRNVAARGAILRAFAWFGFILSILSVAAYFTSPGKILWIFPSPYPDNWGPFLSRNNFAQFLELCFPVALFQMARSGNNGRGGSIFLPATILAAGFASASRAGAILLTVEAVAGFYLLGSAARRWILPFALTAGLLAALAGAGTLLGRFREPDPLKYRREIYRSTVNMIEAHPWRGYGLGTFPTVYPEFAQFDSGAAIEHAHNDWLEAAAEGGLPFAALWAVLAVWAVRPAIRSIWGIGVLAVFLHALVDYPFARFGVAAWEFLLLGVLAHERARPARKSGGEKSRTAVTTKHQEKKVKLKNVQSVVALALSWIVALALSPNLGLAAPPAIGTAVAKGSFRVNDATVTGNATLFEGATVETRSASSTLDLASGASVSLSPESRGRIFGDRLVLERGSGRLRKAEGFRLEARGLVVQPETGEASARVSLAGSTRVQVAALTGSLHVLNAQGLLVASLAPGVALEFAPQASGEPWKITGCLRTSAGHYLLTDETTNITVELAGADLDRENGNLVEITGTLDPTAAPVSGATQLIRANQVRRLGSGCTAGKGKAAPAGTGGSAGRPSGSGVAGISATTISVIGGVAAAAVIGGLAAADVLPGQGGSSAPISR